MCYSEPLERSAAGKLSSQLEQAGLELGAADAHAAELRAMLAADAAAIRQARIDELEWAVNNPDFDDLKGRIAQLKKEQTDAG